MISNKNLHLNKNKYNGNDSVDNRSKMTGMTSIPRNYDGVPKSKNSLHGSSSIIKKVVIDNGNPRYAASKHSSYVGQVTKGTHVRHPSVAEREIR